MSISAFEQWKAEEEARKEELAKRQRVERDDLLLAFNNELGLRTDKDSLLLDGGASYNPFTGEYAVKNQGGTDAFYYNPNNQKSSIYGAQLNGMLDPRIALGMGEDDYKAADRWYDEINKKLDSEISGAITRGDIVAGYRKDTGDSYSWGNELAKVMGGETTKGYKERTGAQYQYDDSTVSAYLQRTNPELYKYYQMFTNTNDTASLQSAYTEQAYNSALSRLQPQYNDDFYGTLKNQFNDLSSSVAKPVDFWQEHWKKQEQDKKMNDEINAVYNDPNYQGYHRDQTIESIRQKYAGTKTPDKLEAQAPSYEYDAAIGSWSNLGAGGRREYMAPPDKLFQEKYFADKLGKDNAALTEYSTTRDKMMQEGASQEEFDALQTAYNTSWQATNGVTKPAQVQIPVAQSPEPVAQTSPTTVPWDKVLSGLQTTLDDYIKQLSQPQSTVKTTFSLSNNAFGDTGTRNSGLVDTSPKQSSSTTASPYTGKAGQSNSTTVNQQALWR